MAPEGGDDLADIEAALAADSDPHEPTDHVAGLDIDTADHPPTWGEFVEHWDLFREPVLAGGIAGLALGFLSVYVVLRRMVFVSASVTQAAGFGVAASFYLAARMGWAFDPTWGATAMALVTAALVAPDPKRLGLTREMVLGLSFALFSGLTVLASARMPQEAHAVQAILFGTAVVVSPEDLDRLTVAAVAVLSLHVWWFRGFAFASFDGLAARVQGLPVRMLDLVLVITIGVMVGESARALGALPAFALSTMPGVAAVLVARGPLWVPYVVAAIVGAAAGAGGYVVAFLFELPVGATQAACAGAAVIVAVLLRLVTGRR
ncbi:MAG TPA: metal ABC transporter permease [Kofleriaceae bacterium]|nr:metal ABC transporter permease [Kofleriaceae bacterium]